MAKTATQSSDSPVPAPMQQLVEVFEAHLRDVTFPEVSAAILAECVSDVERTAAELAEAEAFVNAARRAHGDAFAALRVAADRGIGYARVFARDDEDLSAKLDAIELGDKARRRKLPPKRKEKKPRIKQPTNVAELPLQAEAG